MAVYRYKAVESSGETIVRQMEAASYEEVVSRLQEAGSIPIDVREAKDGDDFGGFGLFRRPDMSRAEVTSFTQQLATLLGAGQPLDRALQILIDLPDSERAQKLIARVRDAVRGGTPLSAALELQHGVFSRLYVNMVKAGEVSGSLHDTLRRLTEYLDRSRQLRASVINALIYPCIIVVAVIMALFLLMIYVIPQFAPILSDMGGELPFDTRMLLALSEFLQAWWWVVAFAAGVGVLAMSRQLSNADSKKQWHERVLGYRFVGGLIQKLETARLARTLGTLLRNGVPLLTAMSISRNVLGNLVLVDAVDTATEDVKKGSGLAYSLGATKRFPRLALQMIAVGEESGELDAMLMRVADTFDTEVKNTVDRLVAAIVPAITIVMALVIAFIMLAILRPILSMSSMIG